MRTSEQINELATALSAAQSELQDAGKDSTNPHFRADYASLASVLKQIRPVFGKHGLAICQVPGSDDTGHFLTTILMHKSGQFIETHMNLALQKQDMQGFGSALSYARRYMASAMSGITQDDDDGEASKVKSTDDFKLKAKTPSAPKLNTGSPMVNTSKLENHAPIGMVRSAELKTKIKELSATWTNEKIDEFIGQETKKMAHELTEAEATKIYNHCVKNPWTKQ